MPNLYRYKKWISSMGIFSKIFMITALLLSIIQPMLFAPPSVFASENQKVLGVYSFGDGGYDQLGYSGNSSIPKQINGMFHIKEVAGGYIHSLILTEEGDVYSFGAGYNGRLGYVANIQTTPKKIENLPPIKAIAAGKEHSLILSNEGDVYSFGAGNAFQLGHGGLDHQTTPKKIENLPPIKAIAAGDYYSLLLTEAGDVYSFGNGYKGQLGLGNTNNISTPTKITALSNVIAIAAGNEHSLVLTQDGDVYSFGNGLNGQLGHGNTNDQSNPTKITSLSSIKAIDAGQNYSFVLTQTGDVYSFGYGLFGQLGHGNNHTLSTPTKIDGLPPIQAVSLGSMHSLVLTETGEVFGFGANGNNQLGLGYNGGTLVMSPQKITSLSNVKAIEAGQNHSFAVVEMDIPTSTISRSSATFDKEEQYQQDITTELTLNGNLLKTIMNGNEALTNNDYTVTYNNNTYKTTVTIKKEYLATLAAGITSLDFIFSVGAKQTMEINIVDDPELSPYGLYSFGAGYVGQLGYGEDFEKHVPTKIKAFSNASIQSISAGEEHSLVLTTNGDVYSFGYGYDGQLGHGDTINRPTPTKIDGLPTIKAIAAGGYHSLLLTTEGEVFSFGDGSDGQLGHGDTDDRSTPTKIDGLPPIKAIAAGEYHSLLLTTEGEVFSFGYEYEGHLGHEDEQSLSIPTKIAGLSNVVAISAGYEHSLVLTESGDVYSFGSGYSGQVGHGNTGSNSSPTKIEGLTNVAAISAGYYHSLVLTESGDVYSFGDGSDGRLGHTETEATYLVTEYGYKYLTTPTKITRLSNVIAISAGGYHSLALTGNGDVYSFGDGDNGRLGHGDTESLEIPTKISGLTNVVAIAAGGYHTLVYNKTNNSSISHHTATFDKYVPNDIQVNIDLMGNTLSNIMDGSASLVEGTDYQVNGSSVIIKKEYIASKAVGITTLTFTFSAGATQSLAITVSDSTPPVSGGTPGNGGTPGSGGSSGGGGGGATPTTPLTPITSTNGEIAIPVGREGELQLGKEATLSIPNGAADQELKITIEKLRDIRNLEKAGIELASPVFELLKNVTGNFKKPVKITLQFDPTKVKAGQNAVLSYYDEGKQEWIKIGGEVKGDTITAEVDHFTKFAVLVEDKANNSEITLSDISSHWAEASIHKLVGLKAINGYEDGTFKPNDQITRAEFTAIVVRALGLELTGEKSFSDTKNHWARLSVATAYEKGIINGYNETTFGANDPITREQMAAIIANAFSLANGEGKTFKDQAYISSWAKDAIQKASSNGIITGYLDGTFKPKNNATRAEAVTVIVKALEKE